MEVASDEPEPPSVPIVRHDGWSGEKMSIFCETLADTGIVVEACESAHMGVAGAYALRRRNPEFGDSALIPKLL
jgi:hypothetical protein